MVESCVVSSKHKQWEFFFTEFKLNSILVSHLKTEAGEDGRTYRRILGFEMKNKCFISFRNELMNILSACFLWCFIDLFIFSELGASAKISYFHFGFKSLSCSSWGKQLLWKCTHTLHSKGFQHWLLSNLI